MKALMKFGRGREGIALQDIEKPVPRADELLVKIMAAGICGTDIHIMQEEYDHSVPVVLGHEFTGIVESFGADVTGFEVGDQIISRSIARTCGKCRYCESGATVHCTEKRSIGVNINGAMAEYMVIPAAVSMKIPRNVEGKDFMALSEPLACCIRAVLEMSKIKCGDVAVITGPGVIGLLVLQLAKIAGACVIICGTQSDQERLALAKKLGADEIVDDPSQLKSVVLKHASYGADIAFECSGAAPAFLTCLDVLQKGGNLAQVGLFGKPITVPMDLIVRKEISVTTGFAQARSSWEILLKLVEQDKIRLEDLASDRLPLADWEKGFDMFLKKEGHKILLIP